MSSDYRELPEDVVNAFEGLLKAERSAAKTAYRCRKCGHVATLNVESAEVELLRAMRREYRPELVSA